MLDRVQQNLHRIELEGDSMRRLDTTSSREANSSPSTTHASKEHSAS
jgi:hypothetical protein